MNKVKDKLQRGETVLVFNPTFQAPALVEFAGGLGYDAAFIDCEHGSAGCELAENLARAARAGGMTSILRPWSTDAALLTRYLDCGIGGLQLPSIDDAATARRLVDVIRVARGKQFADTLVVAMIESVAAMDKLDEIVAVDGIDVFVIGRSDLARSLGHADDGYHAEVERASERIVATVHAAGRVAGINLHRWEDECAYVDQGVRWFTIHAKTMLTRSTRELRTLLKR